MGLQFTEKERLQNSQNKYQQLQYYGFHQWFFFKILAVDLEQLIFANTSKTLFSNTAVKFQSILVLFLSICKVCKFEEVSINHLYKKPYIKSKKFQPVFTSLTDFIKSVICFKIVPFFMNFNLC